jgi:hypothetical protein
MTSPVNKIITNLIRLTLILTLTYANLANRNLIQTIAIIALAITFIPITLEKLLNIKIPATFEIINLMAIYGLLLLGEIRGYFHEYIWWSILTSFTASLILGFTGLTFTHVLVKTQRINKNKILAAILILTFTLSLATLWELFEFTLDLILSTGLQQSLLDTMQDLTINAIGAILITIAGHKTALSKNSTLASNFLSKALEKNQHLLGPKIQTKTTKQKINEILQIGETSKIEFKSTLRTNLFTKTTDKKIELATLKTITAFLNTSGGNLLIGVEDNKNILGLEADNFTSEDKIRLHLTNLIKNQIGNEFTPFIKTTLQKIDNKTIILVICLPSQKPVFLKNDDHEEFYIRNGPSSIKLEGKALISYINHKFQNKNNKL